MLHSAAVGYGAPPLLLSIRPPTPTTPPVTRSLPCTMQDPETHRPRINKPGSVIDREQRANETFYSTT
jgi:hypothetical protein